MKILWILPALLLPSVPFAADDPVGTAGSTKSSAEVVGSKADWSIYTITVNQYFKLRNLVRDAYIEVQTWKAIKANWEEQKNWFHRNHQRWDKITSTLSSLSSNPKDIFSDLKKLEDVSNNIDYFIVVETKNEDMILRTYEDNASVAWDVAGPYLGNRFVPADQMWRNFNAFMQDHTMRNTPIFEQQVATTGTDPGYVDPIYNLPEWRRRNILGKSYSIIRSQSDALTMRREEREKYWANFSQQTGSVTVGADTKADAIGGVDLIRRVQVMADMNDLILSRTQQMQALLALAGDQIYKETGRIQTQVGGINELKGIEAYLNAEIVN